MINNKGYNPWLLGTLLLLVLVFSVAFSLIVGAVTIPFETFKEAFIDFDTTNQLHQVLINVRLPRILGAVVVGVSLSISGALMQGITQNPLADSGLLGINAGAGLGLALMFAFFPNATYWFILLACFLGAAVSVGFIYLVTSSRRRTMTPLRLTLAGAGISALFIACSQAVALQFNLNRDITFWSIGGISAISWSQLRLVLPFFLIALIAAILNSPAITILRFGDDTAISLGKKPHWTRLTATVIVLILSGLSVAVVGSISFVGLIVPHILRNFVGENYRYLVPLSGLGGGLLVVWADLVARIINPPFETPFGIITALIGIPFFIYLSRRGGLRL
ncbi:FecCD family ABC transporter permease [Enterococcus olivae]